MLNEEELIATISDKAKLSKDEIVEMINAKEGEFAGLVSRLGAAYIVGKELGVDLVKPISKELKIKNIVPDMRNVIFIGKIVSVSQLREFETDSGKGYVLNVLLGDETGNVRLSLWDEKATEAVDRLKAGQVWQIIGGYTKKDPSGAVEIRLGKYGNLKAADAEIKTLAVQEKRPQDGYKKVTLKEIDDQDLVEIKAHLLHVSERQPVYYFCSACKTKLSGTECELHKGAKVEKVLIISSVADDGYGATNIVFFRNAAESLIGLDVEKVEKKIKDVGDKSFFESLDIVGEAFQMWGVVKKNRLTNALEIVVHKLKKLNVEEEITSLIKEVAG